MSPFDYINSINEKKAYLFSDVKADDTGEASQLDAPDKNYPPFMVNRGLSNFIDTVLLANEMNQRFDIGKKMHYDFFYHGVRKKKRFSKWHKKPKEDADIQLIKEAYNYSREDAEAVHDLIDLKLLRKYMDKGGVKKR